VTSPRGSSDAHPRAEEPMVITAAMLTAPPRRGPRDFERGMRIFPPLIILLIIANIVVFGWEISSGALVSRQAIIDAGALARDEVLLLGEWWRLLSATFLHGGPDHLIGNMVMLYIVGMACEHGFGVLRTGLVYVMSGLGGSLLSMAMSAGPSVGASGAIFGVAGALIVMLLQHRDRFHLRDKRISAVLAFWAGYQLLIGFTLPFVDNFGHLGGLAGGAMAAMLLRPRLLSPSS
jgi:rhomboid protease GluP